MPKECNVCAPGVGCNKHKPTSGGFSPIVTHTGKPKPEKPAQYGPGGTPYDPKAMRAQEKSEQHWKEQKKEEERKKRESQHILLKFRYSE